MLKNFPIDFVRQIIEQTLYEEHLLNINYYGGKNQVSLMSFYEQLQKEDEVNRYVEVYRDLTEQQNRTGLIMNGTIIAPENPTITNLYQCLIIPMSFTCSFRVKLGNRDTALETINNLIATLKGRKCDIAEFSNGRLMKVGTIANEIDGNPTTKSGDYIGDWDDDFAIDQYIGDEIKPDLQDKGIYFQESNTTYYYVTKRSTLEMVVVRRIDGVWEEVTNPNDYPEIIFPEKGEFTKYKVSMSFDSLRCDEPRTLNANEYCVIYFGGSATLVSNGVSLGNDMVKLAFEKKLIKGSPDITISDEKHWLEPLELPSGNNSDQTMNHLLANRFLTNTHTNSIAITMQYTFIVDKTIDLIKQWFEYARYGKQANGSTIPYISGVTPNMIYEITELWSSWGEVEAQTYRGKIVENCDIENTESDTLTISIPIQLQGVVN